MGKVSKITETMKNHKKAVVFGSIILVIAIVVTVVIGNAKQKAEQMMAAFNQVQTSPVERRTLISSVSASGTLTSVNSKDVVVNLNGVEVKNVSVELGDMVETGQVLCEFDSEDIKENLAEAKTALSVANQKTQMDLTAAERNLAEAKEDYDTNLKRGNTDLGVAYNDYVEATEDVEEAEASWAEAKETTIEKKGELEYREELLEEKQEQLNAAGGSAMYETEFGNSRKALEEYLASQGENITGTAMDKIGLGNNLNEITVGDNGDGSGNTYDFSSSNPEIQAEIKSYISALDSLQASYKTSLQLEQEYASLQKEVSEWQTKYNTAKQNESSYEKAYEQAISASESQLQAYDKQKRNLEDTTKNAENAVISKTDSLTTAQLNALSSGNSEEDKVEQLEQQLDDCTVEAPISGVISAVNIEAGDTYNGTSIVTIDDISSFEITAEIDEYDIAKIEKGQKVVIKTNATGEEELEGTVKTVSPRASTGGNEVTYTVIISVDTASELLRMDMTAKLSIILESKENVLTVPYEAVQEDESGSYYIEVVSDASESNQDIVKSKNIEKQTMDSVLGNDVPTEENGILSEEKDVKPEEKDVELEEKEAQPKENDVKPEEKEAQLKENDVKPEEKDVQSEEKDSLDKVEESGNTDSENMLSMSENKDNEGIEEQLEQAENGKMPQMQEGMNRGSRPWGVKQTNNLKMSNGSNAESSDVTTRKIYIEKGIESDYYIEIISDEVLEGMEVVVPNSSDENSGNIQNMMMRRGPMGGF